MDIAGTAGAGAGAGAGEGAGKGAWSGAWDPIVAAVTLSVWWQGGHWGTGADKKREQVERRVAAGVVRAHTHTHTRTHTHPHIHSHTFLTLALPFGRRK